MPECNYVHRKRVDRISIERSHHEERLSFWGIMACAVCHKPTTTGLRSVLHPVSRSNSDQRHFFLKFVSPGYQWPDCTLYVCRSTCLSKLQQGVAKAADLRKIVNDLRVQHAPISSQAEIHMTMSEDPACETLVSDSGMDSADVANLTHQSQLGKRKVPCEPPYTPEINKMPKIITDGPERMPRRRLSYGTPPASATEGSTPQSVIKVTHMKGSKTRRFTLNSPYKGIAKCMRYKNAAYTVRTMLRIPSLKRATLTEVVNVVKKECVALCKKGRERSSFRFVNVQQLKSFEWETLYDDLKTKAPTLFAILTAACGRKQKDLQLCLPVVAAILLKHRSKQMGLLQTMVSTILHAGHASKRVYTRLNKLGICVSHKTSNLVIRKLGERHDQKVRDWMASCKFTICSQKGDTPLQGEEQLQSSEVQGKRQDDCDQQQWQDGSDQMQRQADGEEGEEKDGSDQGRQNGGDQGRQAGGDRDKQPEPCQGQEMQQQIMAMPSQCYDVIFQGDNVDKNVHVRDMRVDNPNTSLHYFNMYAVKDRVPCPSSTHDPGRGGDSCYEIEGAKIPKVLRSAPCTTFLPSVADCKNLRDNYIHIVATVLVENFTFLHQFKACIPLHLKHKYSDHMAKKSEIVPLGVIPKNENKREEMTEIVEGLHEYVPGCDDDLLKVPFGGDQLTVERTRNVQLSRVNSGNKKDALQGLVPFASDWHAELTLLQIMFDRLYKGGSNCDGGTLLQLRNLIYRRNVAKDVSGRFNECMDFFEMVVRSHIVAAGMQFFGLKELSSEPTANSIAASDVPCKKRWKVLSHVIGRFVDRYVIVHKHAEIQPNPPVQNTVTAESVQANPHAVRIHSEHNYSSSLPTQIATEHCYFEGVPQLEKKKRHLPSGLGDVPNADTVIMEKVPDGILDYACAVLSDGLLMLEFRDGIREGNGERIIRCWKFMLLYFRHFHHYKYALEAFHTLALVEVVAPPHIRQQIVWSRVVNSRGGAGNNIPVDLHMEHLNRLLKDMIIGIGANISESAIVQSSKSLDGIKTVCENFDKSAGIHADSVHHTTKSSKKDQELIVKQLIESRVFSYIPGRKHAAFPNIKPNLAQSIDTKSLFKWLSTNKQKLAKQIEVENLLVNK